MIKNFKYLPFLAYVFIVFSPKTYCQRSAITYSWHNGRFGDCLLNYCKAKWLVYKNPELDFYYLPFQYSDSLKICELEKVYISGMERGFNKIVKFCDPSGLPTDPKEQIEIDDGCPCFYISNYYANVIIDWMDKKFVNELKKTISPRIDIKKLSLPKDRISVAVHVRKGGGYDEPLILDPQASKKPKDIYFADQRFPFKFPPDTFYVEQIKKLYEMIDGVPLYVYIFTDDPNPERIVEKYKTCLSGLDIEFACRKSGNGHDRNVVEDFFTITQFDCFIRNGSNFSFMADIIGDYFIVISLENAFWERNGWVAGKIDVKVNKDKTPSMLSIKENWKI